LHRSAIVKTVDGVRHVFHFGKDLLAHGGNGTGIDALQGLRAGTTVAVHYTVTGSEASAQEIDRIGDDGLVVTDVCSDLSWPPRIRPGAVASITLNLSWNNRTGT
jgi:hypothetical protein